MTCRMDNELSAYVLNALQPAEADAMRQHLTGCPACREEAVSLASTASLLARLTLQDVERLYDLEHVDDGGTADGTGRPWPSAPARSDAAPRDIMRSVRPRRRRAALAVAAAVLAASASVGAVRVLSGQPGQSNSGVVQVVDPATHVRAALALTDRSWGTQLHLTLAGAYPSGWCSLVAHASDGRSDTAASWVADTDGAANIVGATAIPTSQLSELDVVTDTGELLVRITLPPHGK
jgi:anti-sigma factor RsiW